MSTAIATDRIYRLMHRGSPRYAVEQGGVLRLVTGDIFSAFHAREEIAYDEGALLSPVEPSKIVAIGLNYRDHAVEQGKPLPSEPLMFIKPSTSVVGAGRPVVIPPGIGRVDHEAELGVVIGRRASRVPADRADGYILGFTCVNDVTARDLQNAGVGYTRCKGFDTFAPVGPCIARGLDASALAIEGLVNGERRQASNTRELIFTVPELVAFVSSIMTLLPGDIISTGTPSGIGPLVPGDTVTVTIEGIGSLTNPVAARG